MNLFKVVRGQIGSGTLIGLGTTIILGMTGAIYTAGVQSASQIEEQTRALEQARLEDLQRVARVEEAVSTIKDDTSELKRDVKAILRAVNTND